ncbi:phosphoribosylamine--glycine ligase [Rubrimonas cliftonensis]|uniref:Phosphoribosylamine--glycine ligase n=2 Tax=Rubrimonas cliftonensis TaxID=89524 RepID=A0A1H4D573_9RHOB|nr:phosphoribosylamine--glycine ligase [Rubrimonas cliftonensis]
MTTPMNVLLLGSGGREHALAWKIARSPLLRRLWIAPGSAGMATLGDCVALDPCNPAAVALFAREQGVDLVVVGPEAPLAAGVADALSASGVAVFGPSAAAARLESSKSFAKEIADACGAPTAAWRRFDALEPALAFVATQGAPIVVKADGLAAGKGVTVAATEDEAAGALRDIFAEPGATAVVEEFMAGEEASLFALCDGRRAIAFGAAQDHKRAFDGDKGPNTGGMGAYAPAPVLTPAVALRAMETIVRPTLAEMARRGAPYRGVLYAGLMIKDGAPRLVEFNARFGDPEAQVLMLRLESDLLPLLLAAATGRLDEAPRPAWRDAAVVAVVMAARGYPGACARGEAIDGLSDAEAAGATVFHAGTRVEDGRWLSDGGRVLSVCAEGGTVAEARRRAYAALDRIDWPGGFARRDIGWRALGQ